MKLRKERIDRGIKARCEDIFALSSYKEISYLLFPHGIVSREVEPELMVDCLRKVVAGDTWLDTQAIHWVMAASRR